MKTLITLIAITFLASCTDSAKGRFGAYGNTANIKCYSGGDVIYSGQSTGKVSMSQSGYMKFNDKQTQKYTVIKADCVITYDD